MNKRDIIHAIESYETIKLKSLRGYDNFVDYIDSPRQYNQVTESNNAIERNIRELKAKLRDTILTNGYTLEDLRVLCECQFTNPARYDRFINQLKPLKGVNGVLVNCQYYNRLRQKNSIYEYMTDKHKKLMLKHMNNVLLSSFNNAYKLGFIVKLEKEENR